jgi:hypothetical protein
MYFMLFCLGFSLPLFLLFIFEVKTSASRDYTPFSIGSRFGSYQCLFYIDTPQVVDEGSQYSLLRVQMGLDLMRFLHL